MLDLRRREFITLLGGAAVDARKQRKVARVRGWGLASAESERP